MSKKIQPDDFQPANWPRLFYKVFTSFFLAMWVMIFMTIVTLFGTLYQVDYGLFAAKQKYFHSWGLIHFLGDGMPLPEELERIPIPLPGGLLLMVLLTFNIILGALVHVKKRQKGVGMLIAHFGMVFLLVSGYVTYAFNKEGYLVLYEGDTSQRVESYRHWSIEIIPVDDNAKGEKLFTIPPSVIERLSHDAEQRVQSDALPFDVVISHYTRNAVPVPGHLEGDDKQKFLNDYGLQKASDRVVDGFRMGARPVAKEAGANFPAVMVNFDPKEEGAEPVETILSARSSSVRPGESPMAYGFEIGGQKFAARLVKENWTVPFDVRLDQFIFERHPGVSTARNFESRITRIDDRGDVAVEIKMNEPMRDQGFTLFQESYGPQDARPGDPMYSQFAVHNNPADQWPLWSLIITSVGLCVHFVIKLNDHTGKSRRRQAKADSTPDTTPDPVAAN